MARFLIPPEMAPGVYRAGVGFFIPGQELVLPDDASKDDDVPSPKLLPLDEDALEWLQESHPKLKAKFKLFDPEADAPKPKERHKKARAKGPVSDGAKKTVKEAVGSDSGRASDQ